MNPQLLRLRAKGAVISAGVELTARCPLECRHCYLGGQSGEELSTQRHLELQDELAGLGTLFLLYTGGEVFLRPDLPVLVEGALKKGFSLLLKTSGFLSTHDDWLRLTDLGLRFVDISFYGADAASHDAITQHPGSFDLALDSALFLQGRGVTVKGVYTAMRGGEPDAEKLKAGLAARGLKALQGGKLDEISCQGHDLTELLLTDEQSLKQELARVGSFQGKEVNEDPGAWVCPAGWSGAFIKANGEVLPCHRLEQVVGNVTTHSLKDIWENAPLLKQLRSIRRRDLKHCAGCEHVRFCNYCFGAALRDTGDLLCPSPKNCEQARTWHWCSQRNPTGGDQNGNHS
jgi:radical SAM protein with 4Fe4S-binding SPASM domain